ncbi:starch synthase [candidate division LCP-89 bacterium B3_LCP]|uniref:Glycogen synthase n=1 Tax=candidate division LCP-89 bacterium B3_LCP TaxID=2012998 RepID=A0A532V270_UNCL8|nr:MAG: starch synthase [candidate division LCP-89 bacterium B3_LCP]
MPKKNLKILYVSSEVVPFAKTGGLADVSSALPKQLKQLGHDVRVVMPKYGTIPEVKYKLREVIRLRQIDIPLNGQIHTVAIKSAFIPDSKVQVYFVDHPKSFKRKDLYVDPRTKKDYKDNDFRFFLFSRSVLEFARTLAWQPDIIHCNDWQTCAIPLYLNTLYSKDDFFNGTKTILSLHNVGYQGNFPPSAVKVGDLPDKLFKPLSPIEFHDNFSFMKAGVSYADVITTVSEKYAHEIQSDPEYGFGMEGVLHNRKKDLYGILNGIDDTIWNPEKDSLIAHNFNPQDLEGKEENKKALLERFDLEYNPDIPVIGIISRLADQKGFDLISEVLNKIAALDVQMVILGTGAKKYHTLFNKAAKKYPNKISVQLTFNNQLAHQIEAGCDLFLMPSRYEPCGLNQMYSFMYGTVPIVRSTGGLADTVVDIDKNSKDGTGFVFQKYDASEMLDAIKRALKLYQDRDKWQKLQIRGMNQDFSWRTSAKKYVEIYELALRK